MRALISLTLVLLATTASANAVIEHELGDALNSPTGRFYSQLYVECYDTTIRGMDRWYCAVDEAQRQDRQLNEAYGRVMGRLGVERKAKLRRSQRAWIVERDRKCHAPNLQFGLFDPSDDASPNPWCALDMTILRRLWLERLNK
ncbi:MAG: lysozyme inhibitor LprI family protein [Pseudomonadota bacterium]|nr:lysozyme inhibitor LprI family protein [Pseudomonadota bacterium]